MKFTKIILSIILGTSISSSCISEFRDMNTNDHEASDDMLDYDNLRIGGYLVAMQRDVFPTSLVEAGDYQLAQNLTGDIFSGFMGTINENFECNNFYNLNHSSRWNDRAFKVGFTNVMPAWKQIISTTEKGSISYALAQVLKVAAMHRLADNYGPLPYLKFGEGAIYTPYDSLESIYMSFFSDLNEAIKIMEDFVEKTPNAKPLKDYDLIYGSDFTKWLKFANSLKLRLAMHIVYANEELAQKYAEEAVKSGIMEAIEDNAQLASTNGYIVYHPLKKCWDDYSDIRMGANMESFLTGYEDGRISSYFRESTLPEGGFHGVRNGVKIDKKEKYLPLSVPNCEANDPVRWMNVSEIYLLRAEGAIRGWQMDGTAKDLYEKAITLSFEDWGASMRNDYLTNKEYKAAQYQDMISSNHVTSGLSTITIPWEENASFEEKLERIITQKWIALYPDGQEAWTEFRRTNYPKIFPVKVNNSGGTISTEIQVRRITFPQSEYDNNTDEVSKAVSLLGGPDTGGTKLWWDKK